jgi:hypothetical protein
MLAVRKITSTLQLIAEANVLLGSGWLYIPVKLTKPMAKMLIIDRIRSVSNTLALAKKAVKISSTGTDIIDMSRKP